MKLMKYLTLTLAILFLTTSAYADKHVVGYTVPYHQTDQTATSTSVDGTTLEFEVPAGLYDGSINVVSTDADFTAGNIKKDVDLFGVTGTYEGGGGTSQLPKTDQTTSYADYDDGWYEAGNPVSPRFTDNGDGTITDNATSLMWAKDGNGVGCYNGGMRTWAQALTWAEAGG